MIVVIGGNKLASAIALEKDKTAPGRQNGGIQFLIFWLATCLPGGQAIGAIQNQAGSRRRNGHGAERLVGPLRFPLFTMAGESAHEVRGWRDWEGMLEPLVPVD